MKKLELWIKKLNLKKPVNKRKHKIMIFKRYKDNVFVQNESWIVYLSCIFQKFGIDWQQTKIYWKYKLNCKKNEFQMNA